MKTKPIIINFTLPLCRALYIRCRDVQIVVDSFCDFDLNPVIPSDILMKFNKNTIYFYDPKKMFTKKKNWTNIEYTLPIQM